jgi:hypothetical protein
VPPRDAAEAASLASYQEGLVLLTITAIKSFDAEAVVKSLRATSPTSTLRSKIIERGTRFPRTHREVEAYRSRLTPGMNRM